MSTNKNMKKDDSSSFQTVWKPSAHGTITFKTTGSFTIDWGDGCVEKVKGSTSGLDELMHYYVNAGVGVNDTYTVSISGAIKQFSVKYGSYEDETSSLELIEIKQWGAAKWECMAGMFCGAENTSVAGAGSMVCTATDVPDTSKVESMNSMFYNCYKFNSPIEHWDTKRVKEMSFMLSYARMFNRSLAKMDLRNVVDAFHMMGDTLAFDQDLRDFKPKANTNNLFGQDKSLAQYNEKYGAQEQKQELMGVLTP